MSFDVLSVSLERLMNWDKPKKKRWLNARVIAWALYDVGATVFSMAVISRYLGFWIVGEHHGSVLSLNVAMSVSMLLAGILQVLLSPISDEWGRRRVFIVSFTLISAGSCAAMSGASALNEALFWFILANLAFQSALVFYFAMLGDVSDERHKARIAGIGTGLGYVGSIIGLLLARRYANEVEKIYSPIFWHVAVAMLAFAMPLFLFVREKKGFIHFNFRQSLQNSVGSFVTTLRRVASHPEMLYFFLGSLLALDGLQTVTVNMSLYAEGVVGLDPKQGLSLPLTWKDHQLFNLQVSELDAFLIVSILFAIVGAPIVGHIADKIGRFRMLQMVVGLWIFALALAMFSVQRKLFWVTGGFFGLAFGGMWTASRAYLLDLCHPEERGQMFAIYGLVGKGAALIGPLTWGLVFQLFHTTLGDRKAYRLCLGSVLLLTLCGFLILRKARPRAERVATY